MKIITKKPKWQDIDGESQLFVNYAIIEQQDEIDDIIAEIMFINESLIGIVEKDKMKEELKSLSPKDMARVLHLQKKAGRLSIRYNVKDWKGISGDNGKSIKLKLVPWINSEGKEEGTQIEEKLFNNLMGNLRWWNLIHIYNCIQQVIEFNEADKKK